MIGTEFPGIHIVIAIAALKNSAKRSHTLMYCSRYCGIFCLALTAQGVAESCSLLLRMDDWDRIPGWLFKDMRLFIIVIPAQAAPQRTLG